MEVSCTNCEDRPLANKLFEHYKDHFDSGIFTCKFCSMKFGKCAYLSKHLTLFHGILTSYNCQLCFKDYMNICDLSHHILSMHEFHASNVENAVSNSAAYCEMKKSAYATPKKSKIPRDSFGENENKAKSKIPKIYSPSITIKPVSISYDNSSRLSQTHSIISCGSHTLKTANQCMHVYANNLQKITTSSSSYTSTASHFITSTQNKTNVKPICQLSHPGVTTKAKNQYSLSNIGVELPPGLQISPVMHNIQNKSAMTNLPVPALKKASPCPVKRRKNSNISPHNSHSHDKGCITISEVKKSGGDLSVRIVPKKSAVHELQIIPLQSKISNTKIDKISHLAKQNGGSPPSAIKNDCTRTKIFNIPKSNVKSKSNVRKSSTYTKSHLSAESISIVKNPGNKYQSSAIAQSHFEVKHSSIVGNVYKTQISTPVPSARNFLSGPPGKANSVNSKKARSNVSNTPSVSSFLFNSKNKANRVIDKNRPFETVGETNTYIIKKPSHLSNSCKQKLSYSGNQNDQKLIDTFKLKSHEIPKNMLKKQDKNLEEVGSKMKRLVNVPKRLLHKENDNRKDKPNIRLDNKNTTPDNSQKSEIDECADLLLREKTSHDKSLENNKHNSLAELINKLSKNLEEKRRVLLPRADSDSASSGNEQFTVPSENELSNEEQCQGLNNLLQKNSLMSQETLLGSVPVISDSESIPTGKFVSSKNERPNKEKFWKRKKDSYCKWLKRYSSDTDLKRLKKFLLSQKLRMPHCEQRKRRVSAEDLCKYFPIVEVERLPHEIFTEDYALRSMHTNSYFMNGTNMQDETSSIISHNLNKGEQLSPNMLIGGIKLGDLIDADVLKNSKMTYSEEDHVKIVEISQKLSERMNVKNGKMETIKHSSKKICIRNQFHSIVQNFGTHSSEVNDDLHAVSGNDPRLLASSQPQHRHRRHGRGSQGCSSARGRWRGHHLPETHGEA